MRTVKDADGERCGRRKIQTMKKKAWHAADKNSGIHKKTTIAVITQPGCACSHFRSFKIY